VIHGAAAGGRRTAASTGAGSVPVDDMAAFLLGEGYALGRVDRISRLALPAAPGVLEAHRDAAAARAGSDYRLVRWTGATPERLVAGVALLNTRMSTDVPPGDLPAEEDVWTEERVRADDAAVEAGGRTLLVAAVEHAPSGTLVGFTELSLPSRPGGPAHQEDTLVLREHRGRRLGMLLKAANLLALRDRAPSCPSAITFNAEENRPMLRVNEAVGFAAVAYEGAWRRDLA
jgi:GNAT superfamily N-acetyltransferase